MTFDRVRVISKGNKYSIEFIFSAPKLIVRLRYRNTNAVRNSAVGDGKLAYLPHDEQDFIGCMKALQINPKLGDYLIEKYFARYISRGELEATADHIISFNQLIEIATKKYKVPEYKINRLTSICSTHRDELINK